MIELPYLPPPLPADRPPATGRFIAAGVILLVVATLFGCFSGAVPVTYFMQARYAAQAAARSGPPATVIYPSYATTIPSGTAAPSPGRVPRAGGTIVAPTPSYSTQLPAQFRRTPRPPVMPLGQLVMAVVMYAGFAVGCCWLGIAALRKRRYVRPLLMVLSTHGIIFGALTVIGTIAVAAIVIPQVTTTVSANGASPPPFALVIGFVIAVVFSAAFFLVPPVVLLILMRPDAVRATAEHFDLTPRWTDGLPLRVLGLVLTLAMVALLELFALARPMLPALTHMLTGIPAAVVIVAHAAVIGWAAVRVYRREAFGWHLGFWGIVLPMGFLLVSSLVLPTQQYLDAIADQPEAAELMADHAQVFRSLWTGTTALLLAAFAVYMLRVRALVELPTATTAGPALS